MLLLCLGVRKEALAPGTWFYFLQRGGRWPSGKRGSSSVQARKKRRESYLAKMSFEARR
jgi:hypothetical protein